MKRFITEQIAENRKEVLGWSYLLVPTTPEHGTLLEKSRANVRKENLETLSSGHGLDAAAKHSTAAVLNCIRTRELQIPAWSSSPKAQNLAEEYWELMMLGGRQSHFLRGMATSTLLIPQGMTPHPCVLVQH